MNTDIFSIIYSFSDYPERLAIKNLNKEFFNYFPKELCQMCNKDLFLPVHFYDDNIKCRNTLICYNCGINNYSELPTFSIYAENNFIFLQKYKVKCPNNCCKTYVNSVNKLLGLRKNIWKKIKKHSKSHLICNICNNKSDTIFDALYHARTMSSTTNNFKRKFITLE